jgi:hypothetical protein
VTKGLVASVARLLGWTSENTHMQANTSRVRAVGALLALAAMATVASAQTGRFLGKEDILVYGLGLRVDPVVQTVPKDIATIVSTYLQAPNQPSNLPPFAPDAVVKATLRGPGLTNALDLQVQPNSPFNIPPLTVAGVYTLENIRLESQGTVLLRSNPESVKITVIEKLLVTQITARPLSAAEIREKGIVFDSSNFQAYNFTTAFALKSGDPINVSFPVLLPSVASTADTKTSVATIGGVPTPSMPSLKTVIPDTLKLATQIPNLTVLGFELQVPALKGQDLIVPPIPGVIVIPGDIGFLNQYFSVMLMVGNAAPTGSNLSVTDLQATILLPPGNDHVANSADDPLRMAMTARGEAPRVQAVVQAGADGQLGTADDIATLGPGQSGNAEYLVEGRREGSHTIEMSITGTLLGLPVGSVAVAGRAIGAVLVRNPTFTLTFTHPEAVQAGEQYSLDVTITNTSSSPANFVSLNLHGPNVSGATVVGEPTREIESIPAGDSATVSFDLVARVSGKVTASTLDSDENVSGRFQLKSAVGADGVPMSPDSLVLPKEASSLPKSVRDAALGLLGKAWAVATAPAGALPKDVVRFSKQIVLDRAVEVAEAGLRVSLHEPAADSAAQLLMDFAGSNYGRIPDLYSTADQPFQRDNFTGFDTLRRTSARGDVFAAAVANLLAADLAATGPAAFHQALGTKWNYRPGFVSVLLSSASVPTPFDVAIIDTQGRRVGGTTTSGKFVKEIPFSDVLPFTNGSGQRVGTLLVLTAPENGQYTIRLTRVAGTPPDAPSILSILTPTADQNGDLRQLVFDGLTAAAAPGYTPADADPVRFAFEVVGDDVAASPGSAAGSVSLIPDGPPQVISVVQQAQADVVSCDSVKQYPLGRIVAVLFSEEVTAGSVQDRLAAGAITAFSPEANQAAGVALQPGRRIAFVAMRRPFGPYVARTMTVDGVEDLRRHAAAAWTGPMEATVENGAVVGGKVIQADGTAIAGADVRLYALVPCDYVPGFNEEFTKIGVGSQNADGNGRYGWDFVNSEMRAVITGIDPVSREFRSIPFDISRAGQRMNVDVVLLGRGTFMGRVLAPDGRTPLPKSQLRVTSLTDNSQYGATTDERGAFVISRIPVGNMFVEAVNTDAKAHFKFSEYIPFAGATVTRDIVLLSADVQQLTVKYATLSGHVLRSDAATTVSGAPVVAYYQSNSQPGVACPLRFDEVTQSLETPAECPVGLGTTGSDGSFSLPQLPGGAYRIYAFDQPSLSQGEVRYTLPEGTSTLTILLTGGLGTVRGTVIDATGAKVPNARVGGGLTLTTADADGAFVLTDVPVGRRTIVAVSDALGVQGGAEVDIVAAGEIVNVTIVLPAQASIAGRVTLADGATPAVGVTVCAFQSRAGEEGKRVIVYGQATTGADGSYRIDNLLPDQYQVSAFLPDLSDGNVVPVVLRYDKQVLRSDIRFRGAGGSVSGTVFNSDGTTPLQARVGITGYRVQVAGGKLGVGFVPVTNYTIVDTAADGRFSFNGLLVGEFTVRAVGQFSPDPIESTARISTPGEALTIDLRLQATSQVAGVVYQPDGATPAAGVNVTYKSDAFRTVCRDNLLAEDLTGETCESVPQGVQAEYAVSDATGRFLIPLVNAGAFTLSFEDPATGKVAQVKGFARPGERAETVARLLGRGVLTIRVLSSDGTTPIPGAKVEVQQPEFPKKSLTMYADAQGTLEISGGDALSEGEATILVRDVRNGFTGRGSARITSDNEQATSRVYIFDAWGTVSGTVHKPDGMTPVANAEVVISVNGKAIGYSVADANGRFTQDTVPLGPFTVDVFEAATGRVGFTSGRIDLDQQQVMVTITEVAIGLVTGTAIDASVMAPLPGWIVRLTPHLASGRPMPVLQGMTAADGRFSFPGVAQGAFTLAVNKDGTSSSALATGEILSEGQQIDVPLLVQISHPLYGTIEGTVRNPDGTTAAYAAVAASSGGYAVANTAAAADGTFAFSNLTLGRYQISARAQSSSNAGSAWADLAFNNDVVQVTVAMVGLTAVHGQVVLASGDPAAGAQVTFSGVPSSGCDGGCTKYADANGEFSFIQLPARSFTLWAEDPVSHFKGSVGGPLNPGEDQAVRVVLQPSAAVQGRVLTAGGLAAAGVTCELTVGSQHLFVETGADGRFSYPAAPLGAYTLTLADPVGPGTNRRSGTFTGDVNFGDVALDEAPPQVVSLTPTASATRVPLNQVLSIVFSEPIDPAGVTASGISLVGPSGAVNSLLSLGSGDTTVTLTPLSPLTDESRYTLKLTGIKDRLAKVMNDYSASFATVDITQASVTDVSPTQGETGVPIYSTVRVKFSEPIDPVASPLVLTQGGTPITGRTDYLYGNTVIAFTPTLPLADGTTYRVQLAPAVDLAGNAQAEGLDFTFATTDRTPPLISAVAPVSGSTVIENTIARVRPDFGGASDVAVVDFYLNGLPAGSSRTAPFEFAFQATPSLGKPGDTIAVTAIATDTSGNRGVLSSALSIGIVADQPPTAAITSPVDGAAFRNGARVTVSAHATDDVGVVSIGFRAQTGDPLHALTASFAQATPDTTAGFAFDVPTGAAPGSTIQIQASAVDTKGQVTSAAPVSILVLDAVAPAATISGSASGDKVKAGQTVTVTVNATDAGGLKQVSFAATGAASAAETRPITGAPRSIVTAFSFTVSPAATTGDTIALDATATDLADNTASAARVVLTVSDVTPPSVTLRTSDGIATVLPGQTVEMIAQATDDQALARIDLAGSGLFTLSDTRQVSPPSNGATKSFSVIIPTSAQPGAIETLTARATDVAGNVSGPATVVLAIGSSVDVTLPASLVMLAGESKTATVQLAAPAGPGGQMITFTTGDAAVAGVQPAVTIAEGQTQTTINVIAMAGGSTPVRAYVQGALRATMTVAVQGGVVSGLVLDDLLAPVPGAEVTVGTSLTATADASGFYQVTGVGGSRVAVRAIDPISRKRGSTTAQLTGDGGYAKNVNVVVIAAGAVAGTVYAADGVTPAGEGVQVDIYSSWNLGQSLATTYTDADSKYDFPVVTEGSYTIDARSAGGRRGRATATVAAGEAVTADISYLGVGSVAGVVRDGGSNPVANAQVVFEAWSVFGAATPVSIAAGLDGSFSIPDVFVGNFSIRATDPRNGQAGAASGVVGHDQEAVSTDVYVSSFGSVQGAVYRSDGTTTVANAQVSAQRDHLLLSTTTDTAGHYNLPVVPLGSYSIAASEPSTRGMGKTSAAVSTNGQTVTADIVLQPQGTLVVTVVDAQGHVVPGASVSVSAVRPPEFSDVIGGATGADGRVVIAHVLAGSFTVRASAAGLSGATSGTLASDATLPVTVQLEPVASIAGTVLMPNGQSPAAGTVRLYSGYSNPEYSPALAQATLAADGTFRFDGLTLGGYLLYAYDQAARWRAVSPIVTLATPAEVATANLTFVGLGTVSGRVLNVDSSSAGNAPVQLRSLNSTFGSYWNVRTDAAGYYAVTGVPIGAVGIVAGDVASGLFAEAAGALASDGQALVIDLLLRNNSTYFPVTLFDANAMIHGIDADGRLVSGYSGAFTTSGPGVKLEIETGGATTAFTGNSVGTLEADGRQVVARQQGLAGLDVTRRIYVPIDGYFARYVDVLSNPGASPVTANVWVTSHMTSTDRLVSTSSGDASLDVSDSATADRWFTADDSSDGRYVPALAFVFDGAGGATRVALAAYTPSNSAVWRRDNVTVPPGGTVAFLYFVSQQMTRAAAQATAERLVQLPPEALANLRQDELTAVRNFVVPPSGTSTLAALPLLTGVVTGQVFEGDGATPVPGANGTFTSATPYFPRSIPFWADGAGLFRIESQIDGTGSAVAAPIDSFTLVANYPGTQVPSPAIVGGFGSGQSTAVQDIVFTTVASLRGTVRYASGTVVTSGSVTVSGTYNASPYARSTTIAADGSFSFNGQPPIALTIAVTIPHPQGTAATGTAAVTLAAGQAQDVVVTMPPVGTVQGTVTTGGGAPAANVMVELAGSGGFGRTATTSTSGAYSLSIVPAGAYTLSITEPSSGLRTTASVTVVADAVTTQDLQLVSVGIVRGTVKDASNAVAPGVPVTLTGTTRGTLTTTTNGSGAYSFGGVPIGSFLVSATSASQGQYGEVAGSVTSDGQQVVVDITMVSNIITLGRTTRDANNFPYDVYENGRLRYGYNSVFRGASELISAPYGAARLSLVASGTETAFSGATTGIGEEGNREVGITQTGIAGLDVTRKIYVPETGYFARYLEVLSNPGASPVTVDVKLSSSLGYISCSGWWGCTGIVPTVQATSSGDTALNVSDAQTADRWLVLDDTTTTDIFDPAGTRSGLPATAFVFDGAAGTRRADTASYVTSSSTEGRLTYQWSSVTVPAGGKVILMHFVVQQNSTAVGTASAQRLVQLPPEALFGLAADERPLIANFAVPADGSSTLAPLPAVTGTVTGKTLEGDGATPVQYATVTFVSSVPVYSRAREAYYSDASGAFQLASQLSMTSGSNVAIPIAPFTLTARYNGTGVYSAPTPGAFADGLSTATQDVVFTTTSTVTGYLRRHTGLAVPGAWLSIRLVTNESTLYSTQTDGAGRFTFRGLAPGTWRLEATLAGSQWLTATATLTTVGGQSIAQDLVFPPSGTIQGTIYTAAGPPSTSAYVTLTRPSDGSYISVHTSTGAYAFGNIPVGSYTVYSNDTRTYAQTPEIPITVVVDQVTTQDITLPAAGSLQIQVNYARGAAAGGAAVYISDAAGVNRMAVTTDAAGRATATNVAAGPVTVRAYHPTDSNFYADVTTALSTEGQVVPVTVTLPGVVTATAHVATSLGTSVSDVPSYLYRTADMNSYLYYGSTDGTGTATFGLVSSGTSYTARAQRYVPSYNGYYLPALSSAFTPTTDGDVVTAEIQVPAVANTTVALLKPDGTSFGRATIYVKNAFQPNFQNQGYTDATTGRYLVPLPEGDYTIRVKDYNTGASLVDYSGTITAADEGQASTITITVGAESGTISGKIFGADGVTPMSGSSVYLFSALDMVRVTTTTSSSDGSYGFTNQRFGAAGFIVRAFAPGSTGDTTTSVDVPGNFTAGVPTATVNVTMPFAPMTLSGTVFAGDGVTPYPSAVVRLFSQSGAQLRSFTARSNGTWGPEMVLSGMGGVTVRAYVPSVTSIDGFQTQMPGPTGGTFTVNVTIPAFFGTISGRVVAADGVTGVSNANLVLRNAAGYLETLSSADADGNISTSVIMPADGATLDAWYPGWTAVDRTPVSVPVSLSSMNGTLDVTFTLPLSVVRVHAAYADGPAIGSFGAANTVGTDSLTRGYMVRNDASGTFTVLGTPIGPFRVYATDGNAPYFTGFVDAAMADITVPVDIEVPLPARGTINVSVLTAAGQPAAWKDVALSAPGAPVVTETWTDATGHVTLTAPAGPVTLQACPNPDPCTIESTTVVAGQSADVVLRPRPSGTLTGQFFAADGVTPYASHNVYVESYTAAGAEGRFRNAVTTDANGRFTTTGVPAGLVYAELYDSGVGIRMPVTVVAGQTTSVQATAGGAASRPSFTSGGVQFGANYAGLLTSASLPSLGNPFSYSYAVDVNGYSYSPNADLVRVASPGTQIEAGPGGEWQPLIVQRKLASPGNKRWVRMIDVVRNPTAVPLPVSVWVNSNVADLGMRTAPSATGNRYAITGPSAGVNRPLVGHVFAGAGSPRVRAGTELVPGGSGFSYVWATVIPPGGTVEFMHYSIVWDPSDLAGLQAQAQALVDLTDSDALFGLSDEEKARVLNFNLPGGTAPKSGRISGTVTLQDGVTPMSGATVRAEDAFSGFLRAQTTTDASGAFALDGVSNGEAGVAVTATLAEFPGESAGAAVTFTQDGQTVSGLALRFSAGQVGGQVTAGGVAVATPTVLVSQSDADGVRTLQAYQSGSDGRFIVVGLKPGPFTLAAVDPSGQQGTTATGTYVAGQMLALDVSLPAGPTCVPPPDGFRGFWKGEAGAEDSVHPGSDGTLLNTALIVPGRVGNGFGMDGNTAVGRVPDTGALHPPTLTVSAWVKFNGLDSVSAGADDDQYVLFKGKGIVGPNGWNEGYSLARTRVSPGDDRFAFWAVTPDEQDLWAQQTGTTAIEAGRFYHVVGTIDGTVGRLYVNGVLEATFPFAYPVDGGTGPLFLGGTTEAAGDPRCDCVIDEVQVLDRALGADEVLEMYAATTAGLCTDLQMQPATLPAAYIGQTFSDPIRVVNGVSPVAYVGVDTPPGTSVTAEGFLSGAGTTAGTFTFSATATDALNATATRQFTKTILPCLDLPSGVVSLWSGEGNADDSMGVNHATLASGYFDTSGKVGRAFFGYTLRADSQTAVLDLADTFTVEFWVQPYYPISLPAEGTSGTAGTSGQRYVITPEFRDGGAGAGVSVGSNGVGVFEHASGYLPAILAYSGSISGWTHVAVVYVNKTPKLYVNGALVRTGLTSQQPHVYASKSFGDPYGYGVYRGYLDEVALYNRALSASEIQAIYSAAGEERCQTVRK